MQNKQEQREYMRNWIKENFDQFRTSQKSWAKANPEKCRAAEKKYEKANAHKRRAKCKVYYAIKTGKLKRKACQICGTQKTDAHHEDYSKPLEVIWLCRAHHKRIHTMGMEECKLTTIMK